MPSKISRLICLVVINANRRRLKNNFLSLSVKTTKLLLSQKILKSRAVHILRGHSPSLLFKVFASFDLCLLFQEFFLPPSLIQFPAGFLLSAALFGQD